MVDFPEELLQDGRPDLASIDAASPAEGGPDAPTLDNGLRRDHAAPKPDTLSCPGVCVNHCNGGVCRLSCAKGCSCPAGWSCRVVCGVQGCEGDIDCSKANNCTIACDTSACTGTITCGQGACTVTCEESACLGDITCGSGLCTVECGKKACTGNISCDTSCGCSVDCTAPGACIGGSLSCPPGCANKCGPNDDCNNC